MYDLPIRTVRMLIDNGDRYSVPILVPLLYEVQPYLTTLILIPYLLKSLVRCRLPGAFGQRYFVPAILNLLRG